MEIFDLILDWPALVQRGYDSVAYLVMAVVGTLLFLVRLSLAMFAGNGGDFDTEVDFDTDVSFTMFSVLSILAFFMAAGWMGLACRLDWGLGRLPSALISAGFGFALMMAASLMTAWMRRLNRHIDYDVRTAIGRTGRVYLTIPERGTGHGQVEISVSGRQKILRAMSTQAAPLGQLARQAVYADLAVKYDVDHRRQGRVGHNRLALMRFPNRFGGVRGHKDQTYHDDEGHGRQSENLVLHFPVQAREYRDVTKHTDPERGPNTSRDVDNGQKKPRLGL